MSQAEQQATKTLYLVDGTSQLFRAYYALPGLTNAEGLPTGAVYGFTTMLRKLIEEQQPRHLAVAFDLPGPTLRHDRYAEYKANRPPAPEDLNRQLPYAKRVCEAMRIPVLELAGYEADDLIATYTARARDSGYEVVVVASDKDLLQLVGEGVRVFNPVKNLQLDAAAVEDSFGVPPERVADVLGLMGDSVDNIPGVPGVGGKTALRMVQTYGDVEHSLRRARAFVAVYEARDAVVKALDALKTEETATESGLGELFSALDELSDALGVLREHERDPDFLARLEATQHTLTELDRNALAARRGEPGRTLARALRELRKQLKALDKGSNRKVWYATNEHAEQARLSLELARLHGDAPIRFDAEALVLGQPHHARLLALFRSLEFKKLLAELEHAPAPAAASTTAEPDTDYRVLLAAEELRAFAGACRKAARVSLHAVAEPPQDPRRARWIGLAIAYAPGAAAYVPLGHDYLGAPAQLGLDALREHLGPLLAAPDVRKVTTDLKGLLHLLQRHGLEGNGWELDVTVATFLLDPGRTRYPLDRLSEEFLEFELQAEQTLTGTGAKRRPANQLDVEPWSRLTCRAADAVLRLAGELQQRLEQAGLFGLYREVDGPLLPLLARMERVGIRVEVEQLRTMGEEMERDLDRLRGEIHRIAGGEFNVDSPKQLREVLFERLGLKPRRKTAKSKVSSTDARTLEELAEEHRIAKLLLEYRELSKLKGTYVDSLPELVDPQTRRVHTHYHPTGAATGRLSSSDPNLQNIPARTAAGRRIRSAFVPEPGHLFLASDYSQIELRVLAHLCEDPELVQAFHEGQDIHRHTAARVYGVPPDLVSDTMRRRAKAVNFGLIYGMSEMRLAAEQGMKRSEAREFVQTYFERFARVRQYIERTREQAGRDGAVRTLLGRVRHFPQLHQRVNRAVREQALRAAVNSTVQGTAADLMKLAMLRVDDSLRRHGLAARTLLQVHDELLLEVPAGELAQTRELVAEAMERAYPLSIPLVADQKVGSSWKEVT